VFAFAFAANYRVFIGQAAIRSPMLLGKGFNEFAHYPGPIPAETPDTAQLDTLYSFAVLDLRREPIVVSVPDVDPPNTYLIQLGDTSTEPLPYISTITTGNRARQIALVGPDFQGLLPADRLDGVITTRGQFVIVLGRVSILDPTDLEPLHKIQAGLRLTLLNEHLGEPVPAEPPSIDFPEWDYEKASGLGVFDYISHALAWHPPAFDEFEAMAGFARIGLLPGTPFNTEGMSTEVVGALEVGIADAKAEIEANLEPFTAKVNGWNWSTDDISRFGSDYLARSTVALKNIYPNAPDHALYGQAFRDVDGEALDGNHVYQVTFPAGELPLVNWFWSPTLYEESTTMYPNPTGRVNIGDRTPGLSYGEDGSLTVTVTHAEPADPANRLPAPAGLFYLVIRCYGAKAPIVEGTWAPPPIRRAQ